MGEQRKNNREAYRSWLEAELISVALALEPIQGLATDALRKSDCGMMKCAVLGLLKILFGNDIAPENFRERFEDARAIFDKAVLEGNTAPTPGKNSIIQTHILYSQRILVAFIGGYVNPLEKRWLDYWSATNSSGLTQLAFFHDLLLKFVFYTKTLPVIVLLRSIPSHFEGEWNIDAPLEDVFSDPNVGRANVTFDLMQPKENLMAAFEEFVDEAKTRIKDRPEHQMWVKLYDFTRKKDGRRNKPPYRDWYQAILDFEDASEYPSYYGAAQGLSISDEEDSEALRKNLENRSKRYLSLFNAVMSNTFPSID